MFKGRPLVAGRASGTLMYTDEGLSFWGGVDPLTGIVIDGNHPWHGQCITGRILALPSGRGSCTGSQVILELLLNGKAPAGILLRDTDEILALGVFVAEELSGTTGGATDGKGSTDGAAGEGAAEGAAELLSHPIVRLEPSAWEEVAELAEACAGEEGLGSVDGLPWIIIEDGGVVRLGGEGDRGEGGDRGGGGAAEGGEQGGGGGGGLSEWSPWPQDHTTPVLPGMDGVAGEVLGKTGVEETRTLQLNDMDIEMMEGKHGKAAQVAMRIVARTAAAQGATELLDVTQAHIDGCTYIGPGGLKVGGVMGRDRDTEREMNAPCSAPCECAVC